MKYKQEETNETEMSRIKRKQSRSKPENDLHDEKWTEGREDEGSSPNRMVNGLGGCWLGICLCVPVGGAQ